MRSFFTTRGVGTLLAFTVVLAGYWALSGRDVRPVAPEGEAVRITVDAGGRVSDEGERRPQIGFVHGFTYDATKDHAKTLELIRALRPSFWRVAGYNGVYDFVVDVGKFPQMQGTSVTFNFQSLFNQQYGFPVGIAPCTPDVPACFASYEELKSAWAGLADKFMQRLIAERMTVDYFDIFAEPNWGWEGVTFAQKLELFKIAHDVARTHKPDIKIIGIDLGGIESDPDSFLGAYVPFFDFVMKNDLRVDVVSWHEFRYPEDLVPRVDTMRRLLAERPSLCEPTCPKIHINEYAGPESHLIPGVNVGWLYYLESSGIDQSNRACWDDVGGFLRFGRWSTCWAGFNGMLMDDNVTPQPTYWVYKTYAELAGARLPSETNSPRTVALASRDDAKKEIRLLLGRYTSSGTAAPVGITVTNYPYGGKEASVSVTQIPYTGNVVRALPALPPAKESIVPLNHDTLTFTIEHFLEGEAYGVVIRPAAETPR